MEDKSTEILESYKPFERDFFTLNFLISGSDLFKFKGLEGLDNPISDKRKYCVNADNYQEGIITYHKILHDFLLFNQVQNKLADVNKLCVISQGNCKLFDPNMIAAYYLRGFMDGLKEWDKTMRMPFNQEMSEAYVMRLRYLYHKKRLTIPKYYFEISEPIFGCSFVKKFFPQKMSLLGVKFLGHCSALTNLIDDLAESTGINDIINNCDPYHKEIEDEVKEAFRFMLGTNPRNHRDILQNSEDFDKIIKPIVYYFTNNHSIYKNIEPIAKVNVNKGDLVYTFVQLFDKISKGTRPNSIFELFIAIFPMYDDSLTNLKKSTKRPLGYDNLKHVVF